MDEPLTRAQQGTQIPEPADEPVTLAAERIPRAGGARLPRSLTAAWAVAIAADFLQIVMLPFFAGAILSPWDELLDFLVAFILIRRVGWHWAFLPTIVAELIPFVDLVPSWTLAMFIVTRSRRLTER
jgi:hypothetical protein